MYRLVTVCRTYVGTRHIVVEQEPCADYAYDMAVELAEVSRQLNQGCCDVMVQVLQGIAWVDAMLVESMADANI